MVHARRLAVVALSLAAVGCGKGTEISMFNTSDYPVHIWVNGFEEMGEDNKLEARGYRKFVDPEGDWTMHYDVSAGRDGVEIASASCASEKEKRPEYEVVFAEEGFGSASLSCVYED